MNTDTKSHRLVIVGIGGGGSALAPKLARYCQHLKNHGSFEMLLIDGDAYTQSNEPRQAFDRCGNKAEVTVEALAKRFDQVTFTAIGEYLNPDNIDMLIGNGDIVFVCVDDNVARRLIDNHAGTLENVVIMCAGNDMTDGNVQTYIRRSGKDITKSLSEVHPEIASPQGKARYQMSCEEMAAASSPQLFFANDICSALMCMVFYHIVEVEGFLDKPPFGELYFDMLMGRVQPVDRKTVQ